MKNTISHQNNFDILRLFAALQVVLGHTMEHLDIQNVGIIHSFLSYFPGVLVFFVISGFLIFASLDRSNDLKRYFKNRFLRIYPALWVCFIFTLILLFVFKVINIQSFFSKEILMWCVTQLTFLQFWTPDILRSWGVGTPNGSLWTIPVEIQFYVMLPLIVLLFKKININYKLLIIFVFSILINFFIPYIFGSNSESTLYKLFGVSVFPYLYCFLLGSLLYVNWNKLKRFIEGKVIWWAIIYCAICIVFNTGPSYYPRTLLSIIANITLSIMTVSAAYSFVSIGKILKKNDISYGLYIYHMLVINTFISLGLFYKTSYLIYVLLITIIISVFSWYIIEKRILKLKK